MLSDIKLKIFNNFLIQTFEQIESKLSENMNLKMKSELNQVIKEDKLDFTIKYGKIDSDGNLVGEGFKLINCSLKVNKDNLELMIVYNCYQGGII